MQNGKIQEYSDYTEPLEDEPVQICEECERGIYEGDTYWKIDGYVLCDKCAINSHCFIA